MAGTDSRRFEYLTEVRRGQGGPLRGRDTARRERTGSCHQIEVASFAAVPVFAGEVLQGTAGVCVHGSSRKWRRETTWTCSGDRATISARTGATGSSSRSSAAPSSSGCG